MSDADLEYGATPAGAGHEHTDVAPAVAYNFAMWLAAAMLISVAIVYGTFWFLEGRSKSLDEATRNYPLAVGRSQDPPAPRLQAQPYKDVYELKSAQRGALHSYGWVDKANGVVHIPIERAIELTLQRGLPARAGDATASTTMVVQDSSAGRTSAPR
jgi:hypothetical protein